VVSLNLAHPVEYNYKASCAMDRVKTSFVIFDIRALWCSALSVRVPGCQKLQKKQLNPVWHRMLYSCTLYGNSWRLWVNRMRRLGDWPDARRDWRWFWWSPERLASTLVGVSVVPVSRVLVNSSVLLMLNASRRYQSPVMMIYLNLHHLTIDRKIQRTINNSCCLSMNMDNNILYI